MTRPITVRELDNLFFGQSPGRHVVAVIRAAFDASMGSPAGITAVAGYVGSINEWTPVEERWCNLLALKGMDRFRLTEVFQRYRERDAIDCAMQFADIVYDSKLKSVFAYMLDTDWSKIDKNYEYSRIYPQRQHACLDLLLTSLGDELDLEFKGMPNAVVFDNDYGNIEVAGRVYEAWKARTKHSGFGIVAFTKGQLEWDVVPLQCADLLAGSIRKDTVTTLDLNANKDGWSFPMDSISEVRLKAMAHGGRGQFWSIAVASDVEDRLKMIRAARAAEQSS